MTIPQHRDFETSFELTLSGDSDGLTLFWLVAEVSSRKGEANSQGSEYGSGVDKSDTIRRSAGGISGYLRDLADSWVRGRWQN